jgi:DNA topoisomerase IB
VNLRGQSVAGACDRQLWARTCAPLQEPGVRRRRFLAKAGYGEERAARMKSLPPNEVPAVVVEAQRHARASGLVYVTDAEPGISRQRSGAGFVYLAPRHRRITSARTLDRIRRLAIPPAYTSVWICREPRGHLQATGRDARGRKQYRYHPRWRSTRDDGKFSRMVEFGSRLPRLRRRLKHDLALPGLPRDKVLAVVVTLLDETLIRVGNEEYARTNRSYGLTTLRDQHVKFLRDGRASFRFRGKSGRQHDVVLDDKRLARIIRHCQQLPGQQLFQYIDDEGRRQPVDSGLVNDYLREVVSSGAEGFTAKDFRTWHATVRALAFLSCQQREDSLSERAFNRCVAATARDVAEALGNTPAVCRKSYINPLVFVAWREGAVEKKVPRTGLPAKKLERIALALLRSAERKKNGSTR